jgi:hypothetical protein
MAHPGFNLQQNSTKTRAKSVSNLKLAQHTLNRTKTEGSNVFLMEDRQTKEMNG